MRQPTLKQLRYLCAVAEHQHFGQAASACHVSQSTLSAGIGELEDALGVSLVERNNRRVFLTLLGEEVVEDYVSTRLSLKAHPMALLRPYLSAAPLGHKDLLDRRLG